MKLSDSQYPLKKVFYRMFSLLVVVPLIVVFAAAAVILYQVMRTSAVDTISAFQETVATTLNTDIKSASLQLSHFVYVNDGEFLDVANRVYSSSGSSQQYLAAKELERSFNTAMVPSQNILAGLFFMKGGGTVPVKESITLPDDALRAEGWYRTALDNPNRVTIGGYDTSKTDLTANAQKGGQLVLVTAMAPNYTTDRSGRIEMVAYFTTSQVSEVPLRSRSDPGMGTTLLLDEEGQVLFGDMGREELLAWFGENGAQLPNGTFNRRAALDPDGRTRNYLFILRQVPFTGWRIATFVDEGLIMDRSLGIGALLMGVVFSLLLLFFLFSRYFLDAIVMPVQEPAGAMDRVAANDLAVQLQPSGHQELQRLTSSFNQMVLSLKNMLAINEEAQKRKHQAEMQVLQSRITPPFHCEHPQLPPLHGPDVGVRRHPPYGPGVGQYRILLFPQQHQLLPGGRGIAEAGQLPVQRPAGASGHSCSAFGAQAHRPHRPAALAGQRLFQRSAGGHVPAGDDRIQHLRRADVRAS